MPHLARSLEGGTTLPRGPGHLDRPRGRCRLLELHTASGEKTFLPGINPGSTTPGHQPGEIDHLDAATYRTRFGQMPGLGIRVVRVYAVHAGGT